MYKDTESLYCTLETNRVLYVNYTSTFKKCGKSILLLASHVLGCCNKMSKTRWLKTTETSCLAALGARSLNLRCWQAMPRHGSREGACLASDSSFWGLLAVLGVCWLIDGSLLSHGHLLSVCLHTIRVCLCVWISPCYQDTSPYWIRSHPNGLICTW